MVSLFRCKMGVVLKIYTFSYKRRCKLGVKVDYGSGGDNWSYKSRKAPVKSSPPPSTPSFYRPDALPAPHHQCQSNEGKIYSMDLLTPTHPGVFQLCI